MKARIKKAKSQIVDLENILLGTVGKAREILIEEILNAQFELAALKARSMLPIPLH